MEEVENWNLNDQYQQKVFDLKHNSELFMAYFIINSINKLRGVIKFLIELFNRIASNSQEPELLVENNLSEQFWLRNIKSKLSWKNTSILRPKLIEICKRRDHYLKNNEEFNKNI